MLDSLRDDPRRSESRYRKKSVANLGNRITIISDCELPIGPKSERKVLAIEVTDENAVATTIRKLMETDKDAASPRFPRPPDLGDCADQIRCPGGGDRNARESVRHCRDRAGREAAGRSNFLRHGILRGQGTVVCRLAQGLAGTSVAGLGPNERLASAADFQHIAAQASALGIGPISFRFFSRSDQEFRPTYELIRTGQMPQSETVLSKLLNSVLADGKDGSPRKQQIDGHQLPDFNAVQRYLGPAGTFVTSLDDGWLCVGLMMAHAAGGERSEQDRIAGEGSRR